MNSKCLNGEHEKLELLPPAPTDYMVIRNSSAEVVATMNVCKNCLLVYADIPTQTLTESDVTPIL